MKKWKVNSPSSRVRIEIALEAGPLPIELNG